jgi:regulator of sigma E protease
MEVLNSVLTSVLGFISHGFFPFVLLLGLLVFVHELGHFAVAKFFKVRVEVFSLGFGKKIFKFKKGDTEYCISLIPLGGYVKMFGDDPSKPIDPVDRVHSFTHKPVGQRIAVVLAGPLMNLFFAILIFAVLAKVGEEQRAPVVGDISEASYAFKTGFKSGDTILSVAGNKVNSWDEFQQYLNKNSFQNVEVLVKREKTNVEEKVSASVTQKENSNIFSPEKKIGDIDGVDHKSIAPTVGIAKGSLAEKYGLKTGDTFTKINNKDIKYFRDLEFFLSEQQGEFVVTVQRSEDLKKYKDVEVKMFAEAAGLSLEKWGISSSELFIAKVVEKSPAEKAGILAGDQILKIRQNSIYQWDDILDQMKSYSGEGEVEVQVQRGADIKSFYLKPQMSQLTASTGAEEKRYTIGIVPWLSYAGSDLVKVEYDGFFNTLNRGFDRTYHFTVMTVYSFVKLIQGVVSPKNIGGVLSIGQAASETFKMGYSAFLTMMAVLSINLFIMNLLPIPVLDGGHLVIYILEIINRGPVAVRKIEIAQQVGFVLLISLMVYSLFNDVTRIFGAQ